MHCDRQIVRKVGAVTVRMELECRREMPCTSSTAVAFGRSRIFFLLWAKQYGGPVGILVAIWMPSLTV
ncbi:hypothetical protein AK37_16475 [Rhodococcus pyridinivorans AK37]|uniref:Uncharacterized protein n=1 Tax=Rhodococcus pyridinivorans AK37 TaxID=1114960 RepID=H0JUC1_9NOCA|nr:hypothetical protein AK37_16475 [Rhodococcus pyridinivorans AK37]